MSTQQDPRGEVMRVWTRGRTVTLGRNYDIMKEEIINRTCQPTDCGRGKEERNGFDPGSKRD